MNQLENPCYCPLDGYAMARTGNPLAPYFICRQCQGVWAPGSSTRQLFVDSKFEQYVQSETTAPVRRCASCSADMAVILYRGVELDFCRQCRGIWFDRGEWSKLGAAIRQQGIRQQRIVADPRRVAKDRHWGDVVLDSLDALDLLCVLEFFDW